MNPFRRLFGKEPARTALQDFLAKLTLQDAQATYHSVKNENLRLPSAISSMVLYLTNKFVAGYSDIARETSKAAGASPATIPYDAVAFEAAAYIHYWLMQEQLRMRDIEDEDEETEEGDAQDPYFSSVKEAMHITDLLIRRYVPFSLPEQFFTNRVISYSAQSAPELFLRILRSTHANGTPGPVKPVAASLPGDLAAISYVRIFQKSYLETLPKSVQGLCAAHQAGQL
ncbi:MAG: hypothetical protein M5U08_23300 [Burkholderiales bacterium]|nr:hypothetical protein [Burkholderiales bacterium]